MKWMKRIGIMLMALAPVTFGLTLGMVDPMQYPPYSCGISRDHMWLANAGIVPFGQLVVGLVLYNTARRGVGHI